MARERTPGFYGVAALGLALGLGAGCLQFEAFQCQRDDDCVFEGQAGQCRLAERTCVYPDAACVSQWSTASGECLPPSADDDGPPIETSAGSSGSDDMGATSVEPPDESTTSTTLPPSEDTGPPPSDCSNGPEIDLTPLGVVDASSVFSDNFHAFLSVDGDYGSSWFSSGPEPGGPSIYQWTVLDPYCITRINVVGNGLHDNTDFREDYGFESVTVRVYDEYDEIVFQQMLPMLGTPDPPILVEPGVAGVRVELELFEHESSNCGGFSELEITGF